MPNWFYIDTNGTKQGPINDQQLQALIAQRIIVPQTPMETGTGHKGTAGQIPGLFAAPPQQAFQPQSVSVPMPNSQYVQTNGQRDPVVPIVIGGLLIVAIAAATIFLACGLYYSYGSSVMYSNLEKYRDGDSYSWPVAADTGNRLTLLLFRAERYKYSGSCCIAIAVVLYAGAGIGYFVSRKMRE
jgi:hypothetical protein